MAEGPMGMEMDPLSNEPGQKERLHAAVRNVILAHSVAPWSSGEIRDFANDLHGAGVRAESALASPATELYLRRLRQVQMYVETVLNLLLTSEGGGPLKAITPDQLSAKEIAGAVTRLADATILIGMIQNDATPAGGQVLTDDIGCVFCGNRVDLECRDGAHAIAPSEAPTASEPPKWKPSCALDHVRTAAQLRRVLAGDSTFAAGDRDAIAAVAEMLDLTSEEAHDAGSPSSSGQPLREAAEKLLAKLSQMGGGFNGILGAELRDLRAALPS